MRFNQIAREIICKVVYYGPGLAGKTSNMQWVRDHVPPAQASDLVSVDTHSERTLHFDWLALELGQVQGVNVRFEFFTVPGQNYYAATRRQVLQGADGVVFVADSRREALDENIDSMNEMLNNLRHHGLPDDLPVVMQYNKQDLSTAVRREQLEPLMNVRGWPSFGASAISGEGVLETARAVGQLVSERLARQEIPVLRQEAAPPATQTWLISCWRCQTILEVPTAEIGSVYTCGVCGSTLEVTDSERGLTKAPTSAQEESGGYQMQGAVATQDQGISALGTQSGSATGTLMERAVTTADSGGIDLDGYDIVANLDESVQGRRARVRERATGRNLRAFSISPQLMRQPGYRDNLEPYVRMAGPIRHPNVLPLVNMRPQQEGAVLLSNDPPDHEPLAHVLARRRALAPPHAMGLLRQISLALEEAARHGVVHGWLRPDVVLVSPDGTVLIDELCVPKNHRYLVRELSGASAATEYYLAPEHLGEETRSDLRSDIFVLGSLLFRMITGEGLVTGYSAHEALHKVVANGPRPLRSTQAGVSRDLDLFYQRLVAAERKDRFQTYREVIESLDRFGGGAKRQNLKLTGTAAITSPGQSRSPRGSAGAHIATRRISAGSGNYANRQRPAGATVQTGTIRKKKESSPLIFIILAAFIIALVAVGVFVLRQPQVQAPTASASDSAATTGSPATHATPSTVVVHTPDTAPTAVTPPAVAASTTGGTSAPAVADVPPAVPEHLTLADRRDLLQRIADLRTEYRFQAASALAEQLETQAERDEAKQQITQQRDQRKKDIEAAAASTSDIELVKSLVQPALTTWGMPGDADWANALVTQSQTRIASGAPATVPNPAGDPQNPPPKISDITGQPVKVGDAPDPGQTTTPKPQLPDLPPITDTAGQANVVVDQALLAGTPAVAMQALVNVDPLSLESRAMHHKIDWWSHRNTMIIRAAQGGKVKMRIPNPTTNEIWDVVGAQPDTIEVSNPGGAHSSVPWNQFSAHDLAKVFQAAADSPDATPEDNATAVVMCLLASDLTQASLQLKTHRTIIDNDLGSELDALIGLAHRHDLVDVLSRANLAIKNGNLHGIELALAELHKSEKSVQTALAPQIKSLEQAQVILAAWRNSSNAPAALATGSGQAVDHLSFDTQADLDSIPDRDGAWQVNGGMITNTADGSRLGRHDLGNAKSMLVRFIVAQNTGSVVLEFRGARVVLDLAASTYTVGPKGSGHTKSIVIIPKVPITLLLERKDDSHTQLTINNGIESADIPVADLSDSLSLTTASGATLSVDDLDVFREGDSGSQASKQKALRASGWEPINNAYLDAATGLGQAPSIIMPSSPSAPSGIAAALRDNIAGYKFEVKGVGTLDLRLLKKTDHDENWIDIAVDLPKNASEWMSLDVRWTDKGFGVYDGHGSEIGSKPLTDHYTHFVIMASNQATIATIPHIEYRNP
jgi:signal recognition particle receptor subunit beta/serine/threonine protein kinase